MILTIDSIKSIAEIGCDGWAINGKYPEQLMWGIEVVDDSDIPYFVKLESVKGGSGGLWFKEENLKSAKEFEKHNPELQVGDEVLILDHPVLKIDKGINYPESMQKEIGSKHEIIEIHENGYRLSNYWNYEAKYLQKVANDINKSQLLKKEIEVGDLVTLISLEKTTKSR